MIILKAAATILLLLAVIRNVKAEDNVKELKGIIMLLLISGLLNSIANILS